MSRERIDLIRSFGADDPAREPRGGRLPRQHRAGRGASPQRTPGAFLPRQFSNEDNAEAHATDHRPGDLVAARLPRARARRVRRRRRHRRHDHGRRPVPPRAAPGVALHPLEPANSPTLSHRPQGRQAPHPGHLRRVHPADRGPRRARRHRVAVDDGDAILMAQKLAASSARRRHLVRRELPRRAGGRRSELGADAVVVTVFADDNKKYLSTDLLREEPAKSAADRRTSSCSASARSSGPASRAARPRSATTSTRSLRPAPQSACYAPGSTATSPPMSALLTRSPPRLAMMVGRSHSGLGVHAHVIVVALALRRNDVTESSVPASSSSPGGCCWSDPQPPRLSIAPSRHGVGVA